MGREPESHAWTRRLRIATLNGAYASSEEAIKGSISIGKLADFVILEKDPHDVDPDQIKDIKVVRTVVGRQNDVPEICDVAKRV